MRIPRLRKPRLIDVVFVDGQARVVWKIDSFEGAGTEPLADFLVRHLLIGSGLRLCDALLDAGWTPPRG